MRQERWAAFEEFARVNGDSLVRLSFALRGDRGKAEDATQEARASGRRRHAEVNGRPAIELVMGPQRGKIIKVHAEPSSNSGKAQKITDLESRTVWIDAQTYLLLRISTVFVNKQNPKLDINSTVNETWAPRTPARTKLVNHPVIPAGFKHISPPKYS